jgi:uncharacterized protein
MRKAADALADGADAEAAAQHLCAEAIAIERSGVVSLTVTEILDLLQLKKHPTCGFVAETYCSTQTIPAEALPKAYGGTRPLGSAIYFLVTPGAQIRLHRIRSDQIYHHYSGDPLEVLLLYPDGSGGVAAVGPDLSAGMRPQLLIPGGTFHTSRLRPASSYALLGTTAWPGVESPDVELGNPEELVTVYPDFREAIRSFTKPNITYSSR